MTKIISMARAAFLLSLTLITAPAVASDTVVRGKVVQTQGHISPNCRMVQLRRDDGSYIWFRIYGTGQEDGVLAVTLTALAAGLYVDVDYDPDVTTGCGTEPRITWISLRGANAS